MARLDLKPLRPWAGAALGAPLIAVEDASWAHAASAVARVATVDGRVAYLKRHRQARKHRQERAALAAWAPAVAGTPRLLAATAAPVPALLLSHVPGALVASAPPTALDLPAVHAAAGRWLRAWHDQPFRDEDPMPPHEALLARLDGWAERAGAAELALGGDDRGVARSAGAGLGVIDFEHARPDVAWVDVLKLIDGPWLGRPDLEEAFWRGYGHRPGPADEVVIDALRALHAVGTIAWARGHADPAFEVVGRATLARLGIDAL